jgi:hypothetical protein
VLAGEYSSPLIAIIAKGSTLMSNSTLTVPVSSTLGTRTIAAGSTDAGVMAAGGVSCSLLQPASVKAQESKGITTIARADFIKSSTFAGEQEEVFVHF